MEIPKSIILSSKQRENFKLIGDQELPKTEFHLGSYNDRLSDRVKDRAVDTTNSLRNGISATSESVENIIGTIGRLKIPARSENYMDEKTYLIARGLTTAGMAVGFGGAIIKSGYDSLAGVQDYKDSILKCSIAIGMGGIFYLMDRYAIGDRVQPFKGKITNKVAGLFQNSQNRYR